MSQGDQGITLQLLMELFSKEERKKIRSFATRITSKDSKLVYDEMWQYDQSLGGLGGFAMPSDPVVNPFNTWGKDRNLFRSIQYAKASLVLNPGYPRGVIVDVGRSLEITAKYIVDHRSILSRLSNKEMLGKNLQRLYKDNVIDEDLYESCRHLADLTNIAKHEISDEMDRTFDVIDGIVAYFAMRKIHNKLLAIIDHRSVQQEYAPWVDKT